MTGTLDHVCLIGFGEAGAAFAGAMHRNLPGTATAYDREGLAVKGGDFESAGVRGCSSNADAVARASVIISLVTADQAVAAASETAAGIVPGALFLDCNSVAPDTKRAAAALIEKAGGHYLDVAVMAPVHPRLLGVPLMVAGPAAERALDELHSLGFSNVAIAGPSVGQAAAIKMIRSVMIKGIEALSGELAAAADAAGVRSAVLASLDESWIRDLSWGERIAGALERMQRHGLRRAAEMDEVAATLSALKVDNGMALATAEKQRAAGSRARERAA